MIYDEVNTEMSKYSTIYTLTFVNDSIDETLKKHIYSKLEN